MARGCPWFYPGWHMRARGSCASFSSLLQAKQNICGADKVWCALRAYASGAQHIPKSHFSRAMKGGASSMLVCSIIVYSIEYYIYIYRSNSEVKDIFQSATDNQNESFHITLTLFLYTRTAHSAHSFAHFLMCRLSFIAALYASLDEMWFYL